MNPRKEPLVSRIAGWQRNALAPLFATLCSLSVSATFAASIDVQVLDADGDPVPNIAVYTRPVGAEAARSSSEAVAVMYQYDVRFRPHILVVQAGTQVKFPNGDTIAHHVYSFSNPNEFRLPLYKGDTHPPVKFDHEGVVTVGCNIHDNMLGYILVVGTSTFGKTNSAGHVTLDTRTHGEFVVRVWSPRIRDKADALVTRVTLIDSGDTQLTFQLDKKLRPPHDELSEAISWVDY